MKALEKEPARRYGSPLDLAADIVRYLGHEPVLAGPPSGLYRARKFARRHRVGVTLAAGLVLGLVAFAATTTLQARRLAAERDRAAFESAVSAQTSSFLVGLFEASDPASGRRITARELLDRGDSDPHAGREQPPDVDVPLPSRPLVLEEGRHAGGGPRPVRDRRRRPRAAVRSGASRPLDRPARHGAEPQAHARRRGRPGRGAVRGGPRDPRAGAGRDAPRHALLPSQPGDPLPADRPPTTSWTTTGSTTAAWRAIAARSRPAAAASSAAGRGRPGSSWRKCSSRERCLRWPGCRSSAGGSESA